MVRLPEEVKWTSQRLKDWAFGAFVFPSLLFVVYFAASGPAEAWLATYPVDHPELYQAVNWLFGPLNYLMYWSGLGPFYDQWLQLWTDAPPPPC